MTTYHNLPLIVNFVPTGMVPNKDLNPNVPISINEIVEDVQRADEIGITMVHLHARDEQGLPTYKTETFNLIIEGIRKHCKDLVICLSLSGRNFNDVEKRSEALSLKADMGSLTLSSMNFPKQASVNDPEMIIALANKMIETGTNPELEIFDLGMINYSKYLIKKGLIHPPFYYNIILGNAAGLQVNASHIGSAISDLPLDSYWALGGIGNSQLSANTIAIAMGGGVRVGLEDNIYYDKNRKVKATNMKLLARVHRIAEEFERTIMSSKEFGGLGFYNKFRND